MAAVGPVVDHWPYIARRRGDVSANHTTQRCQLDTGISRPRGAAVSWANVEVRRCSPAHRNHHEHRSEQEHDGAGEGG
jgi:hypothetical protein